MRSDCGPRSRKALAAREHYSAALRKTASRVAFAAVAVIVWRRRNSKYDRAGTFALLAELDLLMAVDGFPSIADLHAAALNAFDLGEQLSRRALGLPLLARKASQRAAAKQPSQRLPKACWCIRHDGHGSRPGR
jgi:hypothetical protein